MIFIVGNLLVILGVPRAWAATARGPQTQDQSNLRVLGRAKFSTLRRLEDSVDARCANTNLPSTGLLLAPNKRRREAPTYARRVFTHILSLVESVRAAGTRSPSNRRNDITGRMGARRNVDVLELVLGGRVVRRSSSCQVSRKKRVSMPDCAIGGRSPGRDAGATRAANLNC